MIRRSHFVNSLQSILVVEDCFLKNISKVVGYVNKTVTQNLPNCCQFAILIGKLSPFLNSGSWISIGKYWCSTSAMTYPLLKSLRTFFVFPFKLNPRSHRHISRGNFDRGANSPLFNSYFSSIKCGAISRWSFRHFTLPDFWTFLQTIIFFFECFSSVWVDALCSVPSVDFIFLNWLRLW